MFAWQVKTKLQALLGQREEKKKSLLWEQCDLYTNSYGKHNLDSYRWIYGESFFFFLVFLFLRQTDYSHRVDFLMLSWHLN